MQLARRPGQAEYREAAGDHGPPHARLGRLLKDDEGGPGVPGEHLLRRAEARRRKRGAVDHGVHPVQGGAHGLHVPRAAGHHPVGRKVPGVVEVQCGRRNAFMGEQAERGTPEPARRAGHQDPARVADQSVHHLNSRGLMRSRPKLCLPPRPAPARVLLTRRAAGLPPALTWRPAAVKDRQGDFRARFP